MSSPGGFICVARGLLGHSRFKPSKFSDLEAWLWLIETAAWRACVVMAVVGRQRVPVNLQRGQLTYAVRFLASHWGWSTGRVTRYLTALQTDRSIETETDGHQTLITICNYDKHQLANRETGTQTETQTDTQTGTATETNKKAVKASKKDTPRSRAGEPEGFSEWYSAYPRKKKPKDAERAFSRLMKSGEMPPADLMARTLAFAATWAARPKADLQFCPYPASWLNSGEYLDTAEPPATHGNGVGFKIEAPRDPKSFTDGEWQDRLAAYKGEGRWLKIFWGPPPGSPGCLVPKNLIIGENYAGAA
jgi:hypothetical protein